MDALTPLNRLSPARLPTPAAPSGPRDAVALSRRAADQGAEFYLERGWRWPWQDKNAPVTPEEVPALLAEKPERVRVKPNNDAHLYPLDSTEDLQELTELQDPGSKNALSSLAADRWRFYQGQAEVGLYGAYSAMSSGQPVTARKEAQSLGLTAEKAGQLAKFCQTPSSWLELERQGYRFTDAQGQPLSTFEASLDPESRLLHGFATRLLDPQRMQAQLAEFKHLQERHADGLFARIQAWEGTPAAELTRHMAEVAPAKALADLDPKASLRELACRQLQQLEPQQVLELGSRLGAPRPELQPLTRDLDDPALEAALTRHAFSPEEDWATRAFAEKVGTPEGRALVGRRLTADHELAALMPQLEANEQAALAGRLLERPETTALDLAREQVFTGAALTKLQESPDYRAAAAFGLATLGTPDGEKILAHVLEHPKDGPAAWGHVLGDTARMAALEALSATHPGAAFYREAAQIKNPGRILDVAFGEKDFAVNAYAVQQAVKNATYVEQAVVARALVGLRQDPAAEFARRVAPENPESANRVFQAALKARPEIELPVLAGMMSQVRDLPLARALVAELGKTPAYAPTMGWVTAQLPSFQSAEGAEALCQAAFKEPTSTDFVKLGRDTLWAMSKLPWRSEIVQRDTEMLTRTLLGLQNDEPARLGLKLAEGLEEKEASEVLSACLRADRRDPLLQLAARLSERASGKLLEGLRQAFPAETSEAVALGAGQSEEGRHALLRISLANPGADRARVGLLGLEKLEEQPITSQDEKSRRAELGRTLLRERGGEAASQALKLTDGVLESRGVVRILLATLRASEPQDRAGWVALSKKWLSDLPSERKGEVLDDLARRFPETEVAMKFAREMAEKVSGDSMQARIYESALERPTAGTPAELIAMVRWAEPTKQQGRDFEDVIALRRALVEKQGDRLALDLIQDTMTHDTMKILSHSLKGSAPRDYLENLNQRPQFERVLREVPEGTRRFGMELLDRTRDTRTWRAIAGELLEHPQVGTAAEKLERLAGLLDPQGSGQDQIELSRSYLARLSEQPESRNVARLGLDAIGAADSGYSAVMIARAIRENPKAATAAELAALTARVATDAGGRSGMALLGELGRYPELADMARLARSLELTDREGCAIACSHLMQNYTQPSEKLLLELMDKLGSASADQVRVAARALQLRAERDPAAALVGSLGIPGSTSVAMTLLRAGLETPEANTFEFCDAVDLGLALLEKVPTKVIGARLLLAWADRCPVEGLAREMRQAAGRQDFFDVKPFEAVLPKVKQAAADYRAMRELRTPTSNHGVQEKESQIVVGGVTVKKKA